MELNPASRPSVSRETRLLLVTVLMALSALWALARLRFPERPATLNPVPPILTQLATPPGFEDLAASVSKLQSGLASALMVVDPRAPRADGASPPYRAAGSNAAMLRIDDELAIALTAETDFLRPLPADAVVRRDPVTGLTVLRTPPAPTAPLTTWAPRRPESSRYLVAADVARGTIYLRPVFVGNLHAVVSPTWLMSLWAMPAHTDVTPGTFLFTMEGELAGLVASHEDAPALVPADALLGAADRLRKDATKTPGWLGLEVQALTPAIAAAAGATRGVIVSRVDSNGPAALRVEVTDVIEAVDDAPVLSPVHWLARVGRLSDQETVRLSVRHRNELREVEITADPMPALSAARPLGLTMRRVPEVGVEIVRVAPGSAAAHAGLRSGDVITFGGRYEAPTSSQLSQAFAEAPDGRPVLVAVTRGSVQMVMALERR